MIYEASIEIKRPIDEVFEVTSCQRRCVVWRTTVVDSKMDSDEPAHIGSTFTQQIKILSYRSELKCVITELEPPQRLAFKEVNRSLGYYARFNFKPTASGTQVHLSISLSQLPTPLRVLNQLGMDKSIMKRIIRNNLEQLKMLMENEVNLWSLTPA